MRKEMGLDFLVGLDFLMRQYILSPFEQNK